MKLGKTRRQFIGNASTLCEARGIPWLAVSSILSGKTAIAGPLAEDPRRPQFHLLPAHNWMNDPNGPIYYEGKYHMFFQYNPESAVWGNMSWNHAISTDMVHWVNYPIAFTMTHGGPDAARCFSGSTIVKQFDGKARVYAIYTGIVRDKEQETIRNEGLHETQCLAWSEDPLLQKWTKLPKPVIEKPPPGLKIVGFRDPSVWKHAGTYFMIVGSGLEKTGGCALLYQSPDLLHWLYRQPLASGMWDGVPTSNPVDDGEMWECPEIFPLDGAHVLIYSTKRKVYWESGILDPVSMKFTSKKSGLLDHDAFYAPKSQLDARGRRILWGWIPERRPESEMLKAGWSGMMSLPRVLNLDSDGVLQMRALPELSSLRREQLRSKVEGGKTTFTIPAATGEISCAGTGAEDWNVQVRLDREVLAEVRYEVAKRSFFIGETQIPIQSHDIPQIHAYFDGSVVELFLSDRVGYTKRFYYNGDTAPYITVEITGDRRMNLDAWRMSPISQDRLTTVQSPKEN